MRNLSKHRRKVLEVISALRGVRGKKCGPFQFSYIDVVHISPARKLTGDIETGLLPQNSHLTVIVTFTNLACSWYLAKCIARLLAVNPQLGKSGQHQNRTKPRPRTCSVGFCPPP